MSLAGINCELPAAEVAKAKLFKYFYPLNEHAMRFAELGEVNIHEFAPALVESLAIGGWRLMCWWEDEGQGEGQMVIEMQNSYLKKSHWESFSLSDLDMHYVLSEVSFKEAYRFIQFFVDLKAPLVAEEKAKRQARKLRARVKKKIVTAQIAPKTSRTGV